MAIGDLHDEQEHGERIRSWLRKNGVGLLCGVLLGFVFIAAWQWREAKQVDQFTSAAQQFAVFGKLLQAKELGNAAQALAKLNGASAGLYAELGALQLAKAQSEAGNTAEAIKILRTLPVDSQFKLIADQRLARCWSPLARPMRQTNSWLLAMMMSALRFKVTPCYCLASVNRHASVMPKHLPWAIVQRRSVVFWKLS